MQNTFAGTKPHCPVWMPMAEMMTLLAPATSQPCHIRRPTITVEAIVSRHDR